MRPVPSMLAAAALVAGLVALAPTVVVAQAEPLAAAPRAERVPDNVPATPPPPPPGASAQRDSARARLGERLRLTLYTYGPGGAVFERFGHVALAVEDSVTGEAVAYNWGMFDFNQPNFLGRFLTGDTRYWMAGYPVLVFNTAYAGDNRRIRAQRLALTPLERGAVAEYVAWNAAEENRYYRYDYYRDNCSTRVRDLLDWALGGALKRAWAAPHPAGLTWRGETARVTDGSASAYAGIELALGREADRPVTLWDAAFLPDHLADQLAHFRRPAVVAVPNGEAGASASPLVMADSVLFGSTRAPLPAHPPRRWPVALLAGAALGALLAGLATRGGKGGRRLAAGLAALWLLLGGVLGTALLLAGTVTRHAPYMGRNLALLQLHPGWLVAALLVPAALWRHGAPSPRARGMMAVLVLLSVAGLLAALLPAWRQGGWEVPAAVLPVQLGLLAALWRPARDGTP
jgi:hypothetical protein